VLLPEQVLVLGGGEHLVVGVLEQVLAFFEGRFEG
jgi:hypothetical protein